MAWTTAAAITDLVVTESTRYTGVITPAALTADTNDYAPAGAADATIWRVSGDRPNRALTGIAGGTAGRTITLVNPGPGPLLLRGESTGSAAANRLAIPNTRLDPTAAVTLIYDATAARWVPTTPILPDEADPSAPWTLLDDFTSNGNETGEIGTLNWQATNGTFATQNSITGAPGIVRRTSTGTINQVADLRLSSATGAPLLRFDEWTEMTWRVALVTTGADLIARVGWTDNPASNPATQHGVWVERLAADTSWFGVSRNNAGAQLRTAALVAQSTTFITVRFRKIGTTQVGIQVDRGAETVIAASLPDAADTGQFGMHIIPTTATARSLDIDFFSAKGTGLTARW